MEKIEHHNFFQVYLPKNRDTKSIDMADVLMEEFHLSHNGQITPTYEYDDSKRSALEVILYPSLLYASRELHRHDTFEQNKFVNECIDSEFVNMLFRIHPVYKVADFIEYHFKHYKGDTQEFLKHIKYSIIPVIRRKIEQSKNKDSEFFKQNIPEFDVIKGVIDDWIKEKTQAMKQTNSGYNTNISSANNVIVNNNSNIENQNSEVIQKPQKKTLTLIGIVISLLMLTIALIANWEKISGLF